MLFVKAGDLGRKDVKEEIPSSSRRHWINNSFRCIDPVMIIVQFCIRRSYVVKVYTKQ